jgi:hypothetical protein
MRNINVNLVTPSLFVVMIITQNIVHNMLRLLSSSKGPGKPSTHVVLSQPFPSHHKAQLVIHDQDSPSTSSYVLMCTGDSKKNEVAVATQAKDYSS